MKLELWLEGISAEIVQDIPQSGAQIGMLAKKLACTTLEVLGRDQRKAHDASPSSRSLLTGSPVTRLSARRAMTRVPCSRRSKLRSTVSIWYAGGAYSLSLTVRGLASFITGLSQSLQTQPADDIGAGQPQETPQHRLQAWVITLGYNAVHQLLGFLMEQIWEKDMPDITIYSTAMCPYCVRAKMLLQRKGMSWEEKRIDQDHSLVREMLQRSRRRTVPQIFIGDYHVGGYDDMAELDAMGELDPMLGLIPPGMPGGSGAHTIDSSEDAPT